MEIVEKKWGREIIFANNEHYCGKLLIHDKAGSKGSMHFHMRKHETFYVQQGSFKIRWIEPSNASVNENMINVGDTWENIPGDMHQVEALEDNSIIFEVSTSDDPNDTFRVLPGDGQ